MDDPGRDPKRSHGQILVNYVEIRGLRAQDDELQESSEFLLDISIKRMAGGTGSS